MGREGGREVPCPQGRAEKPVLDLQPDEGRIRQCRELSGGPCSNLGSGRGGWDRVSTQGGFHMTWAAPQGKEACCCLGRGVWGSLGLPAIAQTPSLEGLASAGLGPLPVGLDQKGLDWGHWAGPLSATPRG